MPTIPKTIALIILDGWGYHHEIAHNPIRKVKTPTFDRLLLDHPSTLLEASGKSVGLPEGQVGNSEVGHLHIGSGRKVPQNFTRINTAIDSGDFFKNPVLIAAIKKARINHKAVHILGLSSPGGVHSHIQHITAMIKMVDQQGVTQNYLHAFLDGRDTPPRSALAYLNIIDALYKNLGHGKIASLIGRYYAMDRDYRFERTQQSYDLLTKGQAAYRADNLEGALSIAYQRGENDEFVSATTLHSASEMPVTVNDGDVVVFMNFRADRARQLSLALTDPNFSGFKRDIKPMLASFVSLTCFAKNLAANVAYPPIQLTNTLGECLSKQRYRQLRIAETEKYAHVTYFLNGGIEKPFDREDRILIPSPKVATYDLQPEMSATEVTDKLCSAIESGIYHVIVCNYANLDMLGHTGIERAAGVAIEVIDHCLNRVMESLNVVGGEALITADHGNVECMYDTENKQPHTAHTNNPVPFIYVGRSVKFNTTLDGALDDVAPTLLYLLGLRKPVDMTGNSLLVLV